MNLQECYDLVVNSFDDEIIYTWLWWRLKTKHVANGSKNDDNEKKKDWKWKIHENKENKEITTKNDYKWQKSDINE